MTTATDTQGPINQFMSGLGARFRTAVELIANASQPARCAREAERLFRLSDAELARQGLTRDGIIHHAFARYLYV